MKEVNYWMFYQMLLPIVGEGDDEYSPLQKVDGEDEKEVRTVFEDLIKPEFQRMDETSREICLSTLKYYIWDKHFDLDRAWSRMMPPFDLARHPTDTLLWLWDVLCHGEDYHISDASEYVVNDDFNAIYKIVRGA